MPQLNAVRFQDYYLVSREMLAQSAINLLISGVRGCDGSYMLVSLVELVLGMGATYANT